MMKAYQIWGFASAALLSVTLAGCGKDGAALATVQGDPITLKEFNEYLESKPTVRVIVQNQVAELPVADTLAFQAMQDLVTQKLLVQMAKDEGVAVTPTEVDNEIEFKTKLQPGFVQNLSKRGMSMDAIRRQVELDLTQERLVTKGIKIETAEIDQYIKDNPRQFVEPATADLTWILVNNAAQRDEVQKLLDEGKNFKEVAKERSVAPNAAAMEGAFQERQIDRFSPQLKAAVANLPAGKTTGWIAVGGQSQGFAKFLVNAKAAERPIEMTAERREFLGRQLALDRGRKGNDIVKRLADRLRESKIEVQEASLKELWSRFEERLREAAKDAKLPASPTNSTPSATTGTGN